MYSAVMLVYPNFIHMPLNTMIHLYRSITLVFLIAFATSNVCAQLHGHDQRVFQTDIKAGTTLTSHLGNAQKLTQEFVNSTSKGRVILIRYLGYTCSHCVEQLTYLNQHSEHLARMGIRVVAISEDPAEIGSSMLKKMKYDKSVFTIQSDPDNVIARGLGAVRTELDTAYDLHATMVLIDGVVKFFRLGETPYMDVERVVAVAIGSAQTQNVAMVSSPRFIDRYVDQQIEITQIAGPNDGLFEPLDLDFNPSPLHPNDLWVVTTGNSGNEIAIVHDLGTPQQKIRRKKDSRASHFMWRTMALAMGDNGTFSTAQNGQDGGGNALYMFMGPTLWSSDTAVFASRYQEENRVLASHLDMLHQSPQCLGIAHDTNNVYWILDAFYKDIVRYDFRDPHEIGGVDHRDGIIHRYTGMSITPPERGVPAHISLDKSSGWLYYINPGEGTVSRLQTRSGKLGKNLSMPNESAELVAEYRAVDSALIQSVVPSGLQKPIGMAFYDGRLLVSDRATGFIHVYSVDEVPATQLGKIETGATEILGITVGPDGYIYFVDRKKATVNSIRTSLEPALTAVTRVKAVNHVDTIFFKYSNPGTVEANVQFNIEVRPQDESRKPITFDFGPVSVVANSTKQFGVPVTIDSSSGVWDVFCEEFTPATGLHGINATTTIVGKDLRRVIVNDASVENYNFVGAVAQTTRVGYVPIPVDVFTQVADSLTTLKTMVWNSGSFGEISIVEDVILSSLLDRGVDVLIIADDPLSLRTDLPSSSGFFNQFGVRFLGADVQSLDNGQRVLEGTIGDTITAGVTSMDCQLPRLDHYRGGDYVTNVKFQLSRPGSTSILQVKNTGTKVAVRYQAPLYRTVIMGMNISRVLDGFQRTQFLDKSIVWLEAGADPDPVDTTSTTSVSELTGNETELRIKINANPVVTDARLSVIVNNISSALSIDLYSVSGQKVISIYQGVAANLDLPIEFNSLANGTYFIVARAADKVEHISISKQ